MGDAPNRERADDAPVDPRDAVSGKTLFRDVLATSPDTVTLLARLRPAACEERAWDGLLRSMADQPLSSVAARIGLPLPALMAAITGILPEGCGHGRVEDIAEAEPTWFSAFDVGQALRIDVRPMIAAGKDPFRAVMALVDRVREEGGLIIDAPFNPTPLRRVLANLGFESYARAAGAAHVCLFCRRTTAARRPDEPKVRRAPGEIWQADDGVHIEVRGLPLPKPMTAILRLIDSGAHEGTIVVHHDREPVYLFPELAERGWTHAIVAGDPGEIRLVLRRDSA